MHKIIITLKNYLLSKRSLRILFAQLNKKKLRYL